MLEGLILLVDDDRAFRESTAALLEAYGHRVVTAPDATHAAEIMSQDAFDLVLLDVRMPGVDGISLVEILRTRGEGVPILMISGFATVESAVRALHAGADDFITKPLEPEVLRAKVHDLLMRRPSGAADIMGAIIGRSEPISRVAEEIEKVAATDSTVLVLGETGSGKELVAREIHARSLRSSAAFVPVNCAAFGDGVMESELFGHVRGAFTGAISDKVGFFQAAHGGTLFLDEIGDVTPDAQKRLLRVLQEKEVQPVGSTRSVGTDVRLIAATNRDLKKSAGNGQFREDLYYRLNVFRIDVPPLRDRKTDIPILVEHFLKTTAVGGRSDRPGAAAAKVSPLAMRFILAYDWPGNVRELFAALESALIRSGGSAIQAQQLPPEIRCGTPESPGPRYGPVDADKEKTSIGNALRTAGGARQKAASLLGMGRTTLWRKMKEYGLD